MAIIIENWEAIFAGIGIVLSLVSPPLAVFWHRRRRTVKELVDVIGESYLENESFREIAIRAGKRMARAELDRLISPRLR